MNISQVNHKGQEAILCLLEPGNIFGEVEALSRMPRETLVQALEPVLVSEISWENFEHCPTIAIGILQIIGGRLQRIETKFSNMVFHSAPARLAKLLLQLGESMGEQDQGIIRLKVRLIHQNLASSIRTSRETVSALLG